MAQNPINGWSAGVDGTGVLRPPLVSLIVINWNYAAYVGATINSIKSQDYPSLEAIVVDNGSTDGSREVIAKHVGDDPRFRIVHFDENLGQLGAYFEVFELTCGEFVTIVDADDVLFPHFLSSHVQVHLALAPSVAFTSSNVVEMTAEGRALTTGFAAFGRGAKPASRGLRCSEAALRLSTVPDDGYRRLAKSTFRIDAGVTWIWGPGSSNMYRRSVLALVQQKRQNRSYLRGADRYLCPFCHSLGDSALINVPLSAYRIHDANYFALRETVGKLNFGRPEFTLRAHQEHRETLEFLFSRAAVFRRLLKARFWKVFERLMESIPRKDEFFDDLATRKLFGDNYASLCEAFGEPRLLSGLRRSLTFKQWLAVIRDGNGGRIPARLSLAVMKDRGRAARATMSNTVRKAKKIAVSKLPSALRSRSRKPTQSLPRLGARSRDTTQADGTRVTADRAEITFVLTSCGRFDLLEETLSSFFAHNTAPIARYLVIEDSGDEAVRKVAARCPFPIEVIVNRPSLGQIASIDKAYATVTAPYVFHCEDDWRFFRSGFVEESLTLLQHDPSISVVCSRRLENQRKKLACVLDAPVMTTTGVAYRKADPWRYRLWHGYTFNPGLRRMSDYRMLGSFERWGDEGDASLFFKRKGMVVAYLATPACETTGAERRLPKQKPPRSARSRLQSRWSQWRFRSSQSPC